MPRPVHVICSQHGVQDRESGLISLFFLVEKYNVIRLPAAPPPTPTNVIIITQRPLQVTAAWMKLPEDDYQQRYDYDLKLHLPGGAVFQLADGVFQFEENKPFHRFIFTIEGPLPITSPGILLAESKIRKVGDPDWLSQDCPILVSLVDPVQPSSNPS